MANMMMSAMKKGEFIEHLRAIQGEELGDHLRQQRTMAMLQDTFIAQTLWAPDKPVVGPWMHKNGGDCECELQFSEQEQAIKTMGFTPNWERKTGSTTDLLPGEYTTETEDEYDDEVTEPRHRLAVMMPECEAEE